MRRRKFMSLLGGAALAPLRVAGRRGRPRGLRRSARAR